MSLTQNRGKVFGKKILIIDDTPEVSHTLSQFLVRNGFQVQTAASGVEGLLLVQTFKPDLILLDINMPEMSGLEVQAELNRRKSGIPIIIITGFSSIQTAVAGIRAGAYDYIAKPVSLEKLDYLIGRCFEDTDSGGDSSESLQAKANKEEFELIGFSAPMVEVYKAIASVSNADPRVSVLIQGETGTGKELVARQIHKWGKNSNAPFVALNVTALPDSLVESELFGHEKGAFTGAGQRRIGKLELAGKGTLLLDEIGDISLSLQHKLLRVLQEREFYRLGGSEPVQLKARVVAATNRNIVKKVESGEFREDLYYRLNVISISVPPLRLRREDIPLLVNHFVEKFSAQTGKSVPLMKQAMVEKMASSDWPGNVRQLENVILRAFSSLNSQFELSENTIASKSFTVDNDESPVDSMTLEEGRVRAVEEFERKYISAKLAKFDGNVSKAAESSGINPQSLYRLLKKHNIKSK